jgi:galactose-1-phosphate uridylyltransferase
MSGDSWLEQKPHRRWNPLRREWVLVSPHRTQRPWQGEVSQPVQMVGAAYDPACYLCPGNTRAGCHRNPAYEQTFVFDNDFAALLPDERDAATGEPSRRILRDAGVSGAEWRMLAMRVCLPRAFYPPLLRSATVQKFMVGFEMLGMPQRDITPETAAERLRKVIVAPARNA